MIIGGLVTGVILFIWQFMSWGLLDLHGSNMKHTPNQDKILATLTANLEPGRYFLPRAPQTASMEEAEAVGKKNEGKPWALVAYHDNFSTNMGSNLFRGFVLDFITGLLLCWIFFNIADPNFTKILLSSIAIGVIGYMVFPYLNSVWFSGNSIPELIDAVVGFGLVGLWLGWWVNR